MGLSIFDETYVRVVGAQLSAGDGTTQVNILNSSGEMVRLDAIVATNQDVVDHVVLLTFYDGALTQILGSATIPAGQGYAGTPGVDLLGLVLPSSVVGLVIGANQAVGVQNVVALTGAYYEYFTAIGGMV